MTVLRPIWSLSRSSAPSIRTFSSRPWSGRRRSLYQKDFDALVEPIFDPKSDLEMSEWHMQDKMDAQAKSLSLLGAFTSHKYFPYQPIITDSGAIYQGNEGTSKLFPRAHLLPSQLYVNACPPDTFAPPSNPLLGMYCKGIFGATDRVTLDHNLVDTLIEKRLKKQFVWAGQRIVFLERGKYEADPYFSEDLRAYFEETRECQIVTIEDCINDIEGILLRKPKNEKSLLHQIDILEASLSVVKEYTPPEIQKGGIKTTGQMMAPEDE